MRETREIVEKRSHDPHEEVVLDPSLRVENPKARESTEAAERIFQGLGVHLDEGDVPRTLELRSGGGSAGRVETRLMHAPEQSLQTGAWLAEVLGRWADVRRDGPGHAGGGAVM